MSKPVGWVRNPPYPVVWLGGWPPIKRSNNTDKLRLTIPLAPGPPATLDYNACTYSRARRFCVRHAGPRVAHQKARAIVRYQYPHWGGFLCPNCRTSSGQSELLLYGLLHASSHIHNNAWHVPPKRLAPRPHDNKGGGSFASQYRSGWHASTQLTRGGITVCPPAPAPLNRQSAVHMAKIIKSFAFEKHRPPALHSTDRSALEGIAGAVFLRGPAGGLLDTQVGLEP